MNIGYARVSTWEQNLDLQIDALEKADCDNIFQEKMSGTISDRPKFTWENCCHIIAILETTPD